MRSQPARERVAGEGELRPAVSDNQYFGARRGSDRRWLEPIPECTVVIVAVGARLTIGDIAVRLVTGGVTREQAVGSELVARCSTHRREQHRDVQPGTSRAAPRRRRGYRARASRSGGLEIRGVPDANFGNGAVSV